jgi:hypothetical protein
MGAALKLRAGESREAALLFAASSGDPAHESVRRLMSGPLDWDQLTRLAVAAHATPGLWAVVSTYPNLPPAAGALQSIAVVNDFRQHHIKSLLGKVVGELRAAGIEVIALKGAALLAGDVARPSSRTMSDIDLLVLEGTPDAAWQTCRKLGWTLLNDESSEARYRDHHHLAPLIDPGGYEVGLEIHRSLVPSADAVGVDMGELRARSRTVDIKGVQCRIPSTPDLLLHACLHFAWSNKLLRGSWRTFADAHAIIGASDFQWAAFLPLARTPRARQCCYWTLRLGRRIAGLNVPDEILHRLDPADGGPWASLLEAHFVRQILGPDREGAISERLRQWLWFAAMHERGTTREANELWRAGDIETPVKPGAPARPPRGGLRSIASTVGYFTRLITRG